MSVLFSHLTRRRPTTDLGVLPAVRPGAPRRDWRHANLLALSALSAYCTGIGWQAQQVSYPLFRSVGAQDFLAYHQDYNHAIIWVVIVPGFATFAASIAFWWTRPPAIGRIGAGLVAGTGLISVLSTVAWAIPMHDRLDRIGQDAATIDSLLGANLVRSLALTVGTGALLWCLRRS